MRQSKGNICLATTFETMYRVADFIETDRAEIVAFMEAHPFAMLIASKDAKAEATQIPFLIKIEGDKILLRGHVMKQTSHYKAMLANPELLILFTGPNCYVSASWYTERGHGSTWNYMTVQARGKVHFMDDDATINLLAELTKHFEKGQKNPELVSMMSRKYLAHNVKAIAGFEVEVTTLDATFKLSQNRDETSFQNIVRELKQSVDCDAKKIAEAMKKYAAKTHHPAK